MQRYDTHNGSDLGRSIQFGLIAGMIFFVTVFVLDQFISVVRVPGEGSHEQAAVEATAAGVQRTPIPSAIQRSPVPQAEPLQPAAVVPPTVIQPTPIPSAIQPTTAPQAAPSSGNTTVSYDPAAVSAGQTIFSSLCSACHGVDAHGLPNLGKDLVASEFVHGLTDEELLNFVKTGRPIWDPANTTGVDMPPRGGNPALTDEQLMDVIAYLRTLQAAQ